MDVGLKLNQSQFGAQVLGATAPSAGQLFYLSSIQAASGKMPRGGVPVIFPQFAERGILDKHGFARNCQWNSVISEEGREFCRTVCSLDISVGDFAVWPNSARLVLETVLTSGALELTLAISNVGDGAFSWTGGLHPYFLVEDLMNASLIGLSGLGYQNRYHENKTCLDEQSLAWNGSPCEMLFSGAPDLLLNTGKRQLQISCTGFGQWMVWNPGQEGAKNLVDMPADDWRRFVCIEPVCVDRPIVLGVGKFFVGSMNIKW